MMSGAELPVAAVGILEAGAIVAARLVTARRAARTVRPEAHSASTAAPSVAPTVQPAAVHGSPTRGANVFICYRREDSADIAGRIYDRLAARFGREHVFKDVDSVPLGVDFRTHIEQMVGRCDALVVHRDMDRLIQGLEGHLCVS